MTGLVGDGQARKIAAISPSETEVRYSVVSLSSFSVIEQLWAFVEAPRQQAIANNEGH